MLSSEWEIEEHVAIHTALRIGHQKLRCATIALHEYIHNQIRYFLICHVDDALLVSQDQVRLVSNSESVAITCS